MLKGFGFSGYRSVGNDLVKISPLKKVNLIIGKNNVGKSNIINFLATQYSYFLKKAKNERQFGRQGQDIPFCEVDRHLSNTKVSHRIAFPIFPEDLDSYIKQILPNDNAHRIPRLLAKKFLTQIYCVMMRVLFGLLINQTHILENLSWKSAMTCLKEYWSIGNGIRCGML